MTVLTICETAMIIENIIKIRQNISLNRYQTVINVSRDYCNWFDVYSETVTI